MLKIKLIDFWPEDSQISNFRKIIEKNTDGIITMNNNHNLIIYSCFGNENRKVKCKKIYYTGENKRPEPQADLNLTFDYTKQNYNIRFPLWYLYIDWYSSTQLPKRVPFNHISNLFRKNDKILESKRKFCVFIAGHSRNCPRGYFVKLLSNTYKKVDCAGSCLNNIGRILGGNEETKVKFMQPYKFCIAFENSQHSGYCTEKILHAFMAGCIPIYWGDPDVDKDYNEQGFIRLKEDNIQGMQKVIEKIKEIDQDDNLWLQMYKEICFTKTKEEMLKKLKLVGEKIKGLI